MSFWNALVLIVLIVAAASLLRGRFGSERVEDDGRPAGRALPPQPDPEPKRDAEAEREIEALKERIAVLERIAYDKNTTSAQERARISAEIDALREDRD
ncbi:hypothetical protein [Alteriqipengyuania sp. 357]